MDREAFRARIARYKLAKLDNPDLKYWDFKNEVSRMPLDSPYEDPRFLFNQQPRFELRKEPQHYYSPSKIMRGAGKLLKGVGLAGELIQNLFPSEEQKVLENLRVKMLKDNLMLLNKDIPSYLAGGTVEEDNNPNQLSNKFWANRAKYAKMSGAILSVFTPQNTPIISDITDVYTVYDDVSKGNYTAGMAGAALLALPNILEKPLKLVAKGAKRLLKKTPDIAEALVIPTSGNAYISNPKTQMIYDYVHLTGKIPDDMGVGDEVLEGVTHKEIDDRTKSIIDNWVINRLDPKYNEFFMPQYIYDRGFNSVSPESFKKGSRGENVAGYYSRPTDAIVVRSDAEEFTLPHEFRHSLENEVGFFLSPEQEEILAKAFDFPEYNKLFPNSTKVDYDLSGERATTLLDAKQRIFSDPAEPVSLDIQQAVIEKMSDEEVFDVVAQSNGYGRNFIKYLKDNGLLTPEKAEQFRQAMMYVPTTAGVMYGLQYNKEE